MNGTEPCQVCQTPTDDACVRCRRPTCPQHFHDDHDLAVCRPCWEEITTSDRPILQWPYPRRSERDTPG